ncbi:MAG: carboxypeptidase regulatory-like domain-containing protein [Thermodesulfovibrionales bacterium]|nr:carboxypeptidase regulatory-like domain-containing protein [Thermodesulfovibrionales bacterium]
MVIRKSLFLRKVILNSFVISLLIFFHFILTGAYAQEPWQQKIPNYLLNEIASGKPQELIILFDDTPIQNELSFYRFNIGVSEDTPEILEIKRDRLKTLKENVLSRMPSEEFTLQRDYSHLPMSFIKIKTLNSLIQLLIQREVLRVYPDERYRHFLSSSLPFINQPQVAALNMKGAGTTVAVLDTGLNYTRPEFGTCTSPAPGNCSDTNPPPAPPGCKVACMRDFAPNDNSLDDDGHGTNVSAIVVGVAPETKIAALDVFRTDGFAYSSDIISAINWAIANKNAYNIVALNMSLGGGGSTTPCTNDVFATPIANARSAGILSAVASGNDGFTNRISSPACVPAAVSVGAVYDGNIGSISYSTCSDLTTYADKVTCFSNSATFLTMLAPGASVTAGGYTMFGTSQATPHIAGSIAVLKGQNAFPSETTDQILNRMTTNGVQVTDHRNNITKPRIDLLAAVGGSCTYSISPTSQTFPKEGGIGTVNVITNSDCSWTAQSNISWITITSGNAGSGNGTLSYSVASNSGGSRTGTLTIAGKTFTVSQAGSSVFSISGTITRSGTPLPAVTVNLTGSTTASTTTDANGNYSFNNLDNGNYTVTPALSGFTFTPANRAVTINNANIVGQNFTANASNFTITGTITSSGAPLAGVTLTLTGTASRTAVANSAGVYIFAGLGAGNYTVTPTLSGFTFTPTSRAVSIRRANVTGQNFTATPTGGAFSISGTITLSGGGPLSGVTVTLSGAANAVTTTNALGVYTFTNLANGNYTVTPALSGFTFTPASRNVTINNANVAGQDFVATATGGAFSISGRIVNVLGNGVSGVTVNLTGNATLSTTTNANGDYIFINLTNGSYRVTPTATGLTFAPTFRDVTINNANVTGQNFTATRTR